MACLVVYVSGVLLATVLLFLCRVESHGIVSDIPGHDAWPSSDINFRYNFSDASMRNIIRDAMRVAETGTGNCIRFVDVTAQATPPKPHLVINFLPPSVAAVSICGANVGYRPNGLQISLMNVLDGATTGNYAGSCTEDQRDMLRVLMNAAGLRNEWRHKKRSANIVLPPRVNDRMAPQLRALNVFSEGILYPDAEVTDVGSDTINMDLNSVTMISGEKFAENPSKPVFTLAPPGSEVGSLNRLSLSDCETVQNTLYAGKCRAGFTTCIDPYAAVNPAFSPTATINRALQCQNTGRITLAELLIPDLPYDPTLLPATARPSRAVFVQSSFPSSIFTLTLMRRNLLLQPATVIPAASDCNSAAANGCQYALKIELNNLATFDIDGTGGMMNRKVYVNIHPATGNAILYTIPLTLNLNCAPVFRTLAANVGPNPALASERIYRYPDEIKPVAAPPALQTHIISAANKATLAARVVNYDTEDGIGEPTPGPAAVIQDDVPYKVFVNCNRERAGRLHVAGTTVIGVVQAVDPEGDPVSYYAYSGDYRQIPTPVATFAAANVALTNAGELHTVTKEGVISISGLTDLLGSAVDGAGLATNNAVVSATVTRDVFIVAVDSRGASSVLRARFNLACGVVA